ncbi:O-acetyl-ADP-ribose deacetylase [bacterium]|nr:O-acetyl-ADP-ribose deacetylase [bacterium]QQR56212.1 MAG: O-acetyl-ADP-ribose deacetylase [Candidatus Melainabacteria bacterium]
MANVTKSIKSTSITLTRGDITRQEVEAIVNAANSALRGGGGVDGAIHKAGGPTIAEQCKQIRERDGGCAPGSCVITDGGKLSCKHIIHAVGPVWHGGRSGEDDTLKNAYISCLKLACQYGIKTIAFPSISTGAYGFPVERAAKLALEAVRDFCEDNDYLDEIRFVLFDEKTFNKFKEALEA